MWWRVLPLLCGSIGGGEDLPCAGASWRAIAVADLPGYDRRS